MGSWPPSSTRNWASSLDGSISPRKQRLTLVDIELTSRSLRAAATFYLLCRGSGDGFEGFAGGLYVAKLSNMHCVTRSPAAPSGAAGPRLQAACKPNSVEDDHSSRRRITARAPATYPEVSATRERGEPACGAPGRHASRPGSSRGLPPYLVLLRVGFTLPPPLQRRGALLPHLFTLTPSLRKTPRRYVLCGTGRL